MFLDVILWRIYGLFTGWPDYAGGREVISRSLEHGPTLLSFLLSIPKFVFGSSVSALNEALSASGNIILIVFILFLLQKSRKDLNVSAKRFELISYGLFLAILIEVALTAFRLMFMGKSFTYVILGRLPIYSGYISTVASLFTASFCEGIFLYVLFNYLDGKKARLKGALESAINLLPALFIFNLLFHFLIKFPGYSGKIFKSIAWLPAIIVFITPLIVSKDGATLKDAFKKNLRIVYRYPLDYIVLMVALCLAAWLINYAMYLFSHYLYQPFFVKTNIPFELWYIPYQTLHAVIFIWFSLFCFCVMGAFLQEISYKLSMRKQIAYGFKDKNLFKNK